MERSAPRFSSRGFLAALAVAAVLAPAGAGTGWALDRDERDLVAHLTKTRDMFYAVTKGLTEEQWRWQPAAGRWSIAECAEHLATAEERLRGMLQQVLEGEPEGERAAAIALADLDVVARVLDRSQKVEAPEPLRPTGRFAAMPEALAGFRNARAETLRLVKGTDRDLRKYVMPGTPLGDLQAHQWVLLLSAHTQRHVLQIYEVKTAPGYPAGE